MAWCEPFSSQFQEVTVEGKTCSQEKASTNGENAWQNVALSCPITLEITHKGQKHTYLNSHITLSNQIIPVTAIIFVLNYLLNS